MKKGVGRIVELSVSGGIATLVLAIRGATITVHGETRMTLEALVATFEIAPPPAPPTDVVGKRVRYRRDGMMLLAVGPVA